MTTGAGEPGHHPPPEEADVAGGPAMRGLFEGKVAVLVGVGPGLGRDLARCFFEAGADLALSARREEGLARIADDLAAPQRRVLAVPADVTVADDVAGLFARVERELGRVDAVVYNAFAPPPMATVAELADADWDESFSVNVTAAARVARLSAPLLAAVSGSMVLINSQAARRSEPRRGPYSASKAALLSLARTLAGELGPSGVRVNSVVPGHIWGPPLERFFEERAQRLGTTPEQVYRDVASAMALRRIATGREVAQAVVFLASTLASGITGQSLDVNAGNWWD